MFVALDTPIRRLLRIEDYCRAHPGACSAEISAKAVYVPGAPMLPKKK
jgi:hypothetical protein